MSFTNTISIRRPSANVEPDKTIVMSYTKKRIVSLSTVGKVVERISETVFNEPMKIGRSPMVLTEGGGFLLMEDGHQILMEDGR